MSKQKVLSVTIHDCEVQTFRAGGKGGQNQNKRDTGVRIIHHPSGARGESREERSQLQNKRLAWKKLADSPEMQLWIKRKLGNDMAIEAEVERDMLPNNIRVEVTKDGKWVAE